MSHDPKTPDTTLDATAALRLEYMKALLRVAAYVRRSAAEHLRDHKLSPDEWLVLEEIGARPGANQGHLAGQTLRDRASLSRLVDGLEHRRLVLRDYDRNDKRQTLLRLTTRGEDLLEAARTSLSINSAATLNADGGESMESAIDLLDAIREGAWDD